MCISDIICTGPVLSPGDRRLRSRRSSRRTPIDASAATGGALCPRLPVLERLHRELGGIDDSVECLVGLQHLFGSTASLIHRMAHGRLSPRAVFLLGKPYSTNRRVMWYLQNRLGYRVHPRSTEQPLDQANDDVMDRRIAATLRAVQRHLGKRSGSGRVLLIDDGGRAIRMLHDECFADIRDRFVCVEQTRCGIRAIQDLDLAVPVVNVAESWVKLDHESPLIAGSVTRELTARLEAMRAAGVLTGSRALVIGYGAIGAAVGRELQSLAYDVDVYDSQPDRLAAAAVDGFSVHEDIRSALRGGGIIVGCTGLPVMDCTEYAHLPHGAVLISASSADVEFRAWQLRARADCLGTLEVPAQTERPEQTARDDLAGTPPNHPCFSLYRIQNGERSFYLMNGGFPVNFTGGVDPIPPHDIQLTRTLLFLGAHQASRASAPGLHALDDGGQRRLLAAYRESRGHQAA